MNAKPISFRVIDWSASIAIVATQGRRKATLELSNGRPALSPARPRKGRAFGGVSTQRKTELGRDLQRRADACTERARLMIWGSSKAICTAKAQAYAHAAELADAAVTP